MQSEIPFHQTGTSTEELVVTIFLMLSEIPFYPKNLNPHSSSIVVIFAEFMIRFAPEKTPQLPMDERVPYSPTKRIRDKGKYDKSAPCG